MAYILPVDILPTTDFYIQDPFPPVSQSIWLFSFPPVNLVTWQEAAIESSSSELLEGVKDSCNRQVR